MSADLRQPLMSHVTVACGTTVAVFTCMVNIYVQKQKQSTDGFMSSPFRFKILINSFLRPPKWLRYVTLTVVCARGNLFDAIS